jgi:hypothetical protein
MLDPISREPHRPWYDPSPESPVRRLRGRDKAEFAIAALLLTGLLGLLLFGVTRDDHHRPGPTSSPSPP